MNNIDLQTLESFADYEGTEYGESVGALLQLVHYQSFLSSELIQAVEEELQQILTDIQTNWFFEKKEEQAITTVVVHQWRPID